MHDKQAILLGVNVDHVATLRQARGVDYPDPVRAAEMAMASGADSITVHLREDRRHIQEHDVTAIRELQNTPLNLEMAATDEMCRFAVELQPDYCCIVPEKREELTTEGGLDVIPAKDRLLDVCQALKGAGIRVSLFIDPEEAQIVAARDVGADMIEIHTGHFANVASKNMIRTELDRIRSGVETGIESGLQVNAGHGLHYGNVQDISAIRAITELNIGHSIVARAVLTGFAEAVQTMKTLMLESRR
ncbi:MAG: pyridoxine 5'-phosphate synthase [Thiotrichales bacterium]|nr:pyridoxine 5'-phosphate synthase [Thiotrichales bacterium]